MAATPCFSVVIPSFNYGRFLGECLASIYAQEKAPDFEVIVVDDGSSDETAEVLEGWRRPNLRVLKHPRNLGHVATINDGLALARGEIVSRIDPDDRYRPHFMATVCEKLSAFPDVGLVYGNAAIVDVTGAQTGHVTQRPHKGDFKGSELLRLLECNFICAPTVAARRGVWLESLPVPGGLAFHDWYFTLLAARRHPFYFVDDVVADYRVHSGNHHSIISKDGSEERSVLRLLDTVYREPEEDPVVEEQKQRVKQRVYAAHYVDFADKYFWWERDAEARRCYTAALRRRPASFLSFGVARRYAATVIGRRWYEMAKSAFTRKVRAGDSITN